MIVASIVVSSLVVLGVIVVLVMVARSPEGFENGLGYHSGRDSQDRPQPDRQRG